MKMNNHDFPRNYSESDLNNFINQGKRKAEYINRIIDTDIHINMVSESNSPLKEKSKYLRNDYNINSKNYYNDYNDNIEKYNRVNNNQRIMDYQNKNFQRESEFNNINKNIENFNYNYEFNTDRNNNINNSLNLNKPFHCERRHFPLINNKGNFFKNITPFLVGNTERLNIIRNKNNNRYIHNYDNQNMKRYQGEKLRRSSSMADIPINYSNNKRNLIKNINRDNYSENLAYSMGDTLEKRYKYYNPRRYDYEGSRYGDKTYNYYLNSPMRSDISSDWKFPPIYYYNYRPKENNSNY